jgi:hypothetical protein
VPRIRLLTYSSRRFLGLRLILHPEQAIHRHARRYGCRKVVLTLHGELTTKPDRGSIRRLTGLAGPHQIPAPTRPSCPSRVA